MLEQDDNPEKLERGATVSNKPDEINSENPILDSGREENNKNEPNEPDNNEQRARA